MGIFGVLLALVGLASDLRSFFGSLSNDDVRGVAKEISRRLSYAVEITPQGLATLFDDQGFMGELLAPAPDPDRLRSLVIAQVTGLNLQPSEEDAVVGVVVAELVSVVLGRAPLVDQLSVRLIQQLAREVDGLRSQVEKSAAVNTLDAGAFVDALIDVLAELRALRQLAEAQGRVLAAQKSRSDLRVARRVVAFLEDRRSLYKDFDAEVRAHVVASIEAIRTCVVEALSEAESELLCGRLRAIGQACRDFADATEHSVPDARFYLELGQLRAVVASHLQAIAREYRLGLSQEIGELLGGS